MVCPTVTMLYHNSGNFVTAPRIYANVEQRWKVCAAEDPATSTNIKNKLNIQFITQREHFVHDSDKLVHTVGGNNSYLFVNGTHSINTLCGKMHIPMVLKQVVYGATTVP